MGLWSKETIKFAYESTSAKETVFLAMTEAPIPTIAVLSLVRSVCDLYRHQSWTGSQKHIQSVQKLWTSDMVRSNFPPIL